MKIAICVLEIQDCIELNFKSIKHHVERICLKKEVELIVFSQGILNGLYNCESLNYDEKNDNDIRDEFINKIAELSKKYKVCISFGFTKDDKKNSNSYVLFNSKGEVSLNQSEGVINENLNKFGIAIGNDLFNKEYCDNLIENKVKYIIHPFAKKETKFISWEEALMLYCERAKEIGISIIGAGYIDDDYIGSGFYVDYKQGLKAYLERDHIGILFVDTNKELPCKDNSCNSNCKKGCLNA